MKKNTSNNIHNILKNNTLGSSEIVELLNSYLFSIRNSKTQFQNSIKIAKNKLGHFEAVNSYLNELSKILKYNNLDLLNFLESKTKKEKENIENIFNKIYPSLKKIKSIITLSRSKTVIEILKILHQRNQKLKVIVCESRPIKEGRLTALELAKAGLKVELITDAMMGTYVHKTEAAIIGADSILKKESVVNKVGSKTLALFCKEYKKPFYVVTSRSKFSNKIRYKPKKENPIEVWNKKAENLVVTNIYFEEVEKKLITKIFTD